MDKQEILAILDALPTHDLDYSFSDYQRVWRALGPKTTLTTVCVGGFRLLVHHIGDVLVSIAPRSNSAGRGHVKLMARKQCASWMHDGLHYDSDDHGRARTVAAVNICLDAWIASKGDIPALYRIVGSPANRCAICGATLTDSVSMARGIGPECVKKIYVDSDIRELVLASRAS